VRIGPLIRPRVRDSSPVLVTGATFAVLGFVMHRLDVSVTRLGRASGAHCAPSWMEVMVSVGLVASGFAAFALAVRFLPAFSAPGHSPTGRSTPARRPAAGIPG
jgi:Ni/Fe-hydrogenase subunit HybB-like protein